MKTIVNKPVQLRFEILSKFLASLGMILIFAFNSLGQIQGGVFSEKKEGLPNALLIAKDTTGHIMDSVRTDKRGFYSFKSLKKGKYNIEVKAAGFLSKIFEKIEVINETSGEEGYRNDISGDSRLEIFLSPLKTSR